MNKILILLAPQWWTFKNKLFSGSSSFYLRAVFFLLFGGGLWGGAIILLNTALSRLNNLSGDAGRILTLKGLSLFVLVSFFVLFFSGLITALSRFYLSLELPMLFCFPVSRGKVFGAKWIETLISSSWMVLLFGLPLFIAFGIQFDVSPLYYPWLIFVLLTFLPIPVGLGIWAAILIMSIIPARRGKSLFTFLGFLVIGLLYMLFRFMQPERLINPEWFANLTMFLADMQTPTSPFMPSMWVAEALGPFFQTGEGTPFYYLLLILFTSGATAVFGYWSFEALYHRGWLKAQEGTSKTMSKNPGASSVRHGLRWSGIYTGFLAPVSKTPASVSRALTEKDLRLFLRDEGQMSQAPLLITLIVIYLFSIRALPLEWGSLVGMAIKYLVAFLNIALVGVVISSLAARFLFPSVSAEGRAFWLIRTAPIRLRSFLWNKFLLHLVPMLVISLLLIGISTYLLHVKAWMVWVSVVTAIMLCASLTGLAIGMGAIYPKFEAQNPSEVQTGIHGTYYMLLSVLLIVITVTLEAIPTIGLFLGDVSGGTLLPKAKLVIGAFFFAALLANVLFLYIPMRRGEKSLSKV